MASTWSRFSEPSTACFMCSGRLSWPADFGFPLESTSILCPNLVPINHLPAEWCKSLAHELFVGEGAVHLRGVEEGDATLDGRTNEGDELRRVWGRAVAL